MGVRQSELRTLLSLVRPRKPYRELAKRIARSLVPFNAVHIRRGDFCYAQLTPCAGRVRCGEITRNLASRLSRTDRLVVCTDSSSEEEWPAPLRKDFQDVVFLDRLLLNAWRSEFHRLPHHDDSVLGLITQLVAAQAECFVGTLCSTFTALIQRLRGINGKADAFLYCYSDWDAKLVPFERCEFVPVQDGCYSWNRVLYPVEPYVYSCFREWPESFQCAATAAGSGTVPEGTLYLRASEAQVHGVEARYECSTLHDNIGYWTNQDDCVVWKFSVSVPMFSQVEIRYACPGDCAGSTFSVTLEDDESICASVADTGGWTMFSIWQRIGTMRILPGERTLVVRILMMPAVAAMNLAGIRLLPTAFG